MSDNSDQLLQTTLNDDIVFESPNVPQFPISRIKKSGKPKQFVTNKFPINMITPIYDNCIIDSYTSHHLLKYVEVTPNTEFLEEVSKIKFSSTFSKVHIYRTVSEILNLKNCSFLYDNVQIIGIYKHGKLNNINCHYIEDRRTKNKIEIDLNITDHYPEENSVILIFGTIVLKSFPSNSKCEMVPYILVKFYNNLHNPHHPEAYETVFHFQKQFRPKEFDLIKNFDDTSDQTMLNLDETNFGNKNNATFSDFNTTALMKIELD